MTLLREGSFGEKSAISNSDERAKSLHQLDECRLASVAAKECIDRGCGNRIPVQFALSVSNRLVVMLFTVTSLIQVGQTEIAERTVVLDEFWHIVAILEEAFLLVVATPYTL